MAGVGILRSEHHSSVQKTSCVVPDGVAGTIKALQALFKVLFKVGSAIEAPLQAVGNAALKLLLSALVHDAARSERHRPSGAFSLHRHCLDSAMVGPGLVMVDFSAGKRRRQWCSEAAYAAPSLHDRSMFSPLKDSTRVVAKIGA
ncbi:hypothetical protein CK203_030822 [Vitis vinifera]|uniref:Uncharacterized protein n=1 Tax=Vitis vinifera TaxID=29760 RepID=A0A438ID27_VITVI|nr:hypothetical protein CK203_030822 [Vitis vinifera]